MKTFAMIVFVGILTVLLFDTLGSLAAKALGFPYPLLMVGSVFIYALVGFAAGMRGGVALALLAGALTGLADSTLGWYISLRLGPAQPALEATIPLILMTVIVVMGLAAVFGLLGGLIAKLVRVKA